MDYNEAVVYLDGKIKFGIRPGLERISALCRKLGNPHDSFRSIHIAGTNGKTSTARIASSILTEHGLKVGTYTSPHLALYTERFLINAEPIAEEYFGQCLNQIIPCVEAVNGECPEPLTHFEILTALAFFLFARERIDCGVIETGMGGRWDATNIINSRVAVVTNVDLEHTDVLGKTISKIAWEKAHIIKKGCSAIGGNLNEEALTVIRDRCANENVESKIFGADFSLVSTKKVSETAQLISVKGLYAGYDNLSLPLAGGHQAENASVAAATCEAFLKKALSLKKIRQAFERASSPGRFELIRREPLIVLDGAHNPAGIRRLAATLKQVVFNKLVLVLAILEEKNVQEMLEAIIPLANLTIVTENHSDRCMNADHLSAEVSRLTEDYFTEKDLTRALKLAVKEAKKGDMVLVTGSLYTVGEAREFLHKGVSEGRVEICDTK